MNRAWDAAKTAGCLTAFFIALFGGLIAVVGLAAKFVGPLGVAALWVVGMFGGIWLLSLAASGTEAGTAETTKIGSVHEGPTRKAGDAQ